MAVFFKDLDTVVSWDSLIRELNEPQSFNPYCYEKDVYPIFKRIIISMLHGISITLLDSDFSKDEIDNLVEGKDIVKPGKQLNGLTPALTSKEDLISRLAQTSSDWRITLFTSGTTGLPKKVSHSFTSISRFVKVASSHKNDIWGFAYNATHMAGIQVFLQALLNGNTIVNIFNISGDSILEEIRMNGVTHISATPTYYRLLSFSNNDFFSVRRITSGGERISDQILDKLKRIFKNAKITNVYASTEAGTLFASNDDLFTIKPDLAHLVKVTDNKLFIHKSLLGDTSLELDEWYDTGDLVELINTSPLQIKFVARQNEMINVGGYKVDPNEVENCILAIEGVSNARVYSKKNSVIGNIICCEVVRLTNGPNESKIRSFLQKHLQEFKIPRIIKFTDQVLSTRTGKTKRI